MSRKIVVGVMGGGESAPPHAIREAYQLGELIAEQGWVLLNGGRRAGVMDASAAGARSKGGLVVGILPDADTHQASPHVDICILTGMGSARNVINVLSSDVVIACAGEEGTISEVALALKHGKTVIALNFDLGGLFAQARAAGRLLSASTPQEAVQIARQVLKAGHRDAVT